MVTPLEYCIQFRTYPGKDSILQQYENIGLGLGASVVANLDSKLHVMQTSNYHIVMHNYFTSPDLVGHLSAKGIVCNRNGESRPNGKCSIARYGKNEQREGWIIRCGY